MPSYASTSQLLRCSLKDQFYILQISSYLNDIIKDIFGSEISNKLIFYVEITSDFLYYSCTNLSGLQTIGEEFVNVLQVNNDATSIQSFKVRFFALILRIFTTYIIKEIQDDNSSYNHESKLKLLLTKLNPQLNNYLKLFIDFLNQFHLSIFYLFGGCYDPSKRMTNTKYVQTRQLNDNNSFLQWIGILKLIQTCSQFALNIKQQQNLKNCNEQINDETVYFKSNKLCILCFDLISNQTLAPCGHTFCWLCIQQSLTHKKECPICKQYLLPSRCIPLRN